MKNALNRLAWIALFAGLVFLTAFAARELDRALAVRTEALKAAALQALESMLGRSVSYQGISPSFFRQLTVRDLTIHDSEDPSRPLLTIHEVQIYYSLLHLLAARDPVGAIREVRLLNSSFTVDLERDRDVVQLVQRLLEAGNGRGSDGGVAAAPGSPSGGVSPMRARISGADIALTLISRGTVVNLRHLFFNVDAQSPSIALTVRGDVGGRLASGFTFDSSLKAQGTVERSLDASDVTVRLLSFSSSLVNAGAQTLQLVWKGSTVDVRKIQDRSPVVLDLEANLADREFTLNFQSQDMRPDRLISFARPLQRYSAWLRIPLTASGHVTYRADHGTLEYQADASAWLEDQLPIRQVTLSTSVRGSEKTAYFSPLRLSSEGGTAEFEGSVDLATLYPSGLLSLKDVHTGYGENLEANLALDRGPGGSLAVHGNNLKIGELGFDTFLLSLAPAESGAAFTLSTSFSGSGQEDVLQANGKLLMGQRLGSVVGVGAVQPLATPTVSVTASLRNVPPAKLYHLLVGAGRLSIDQQDVYSLLSHYLVSTEAALTTDFSHLSLSARSVAVTSIDDPDIGFHFGLGVDKSHLSLTAFTGTYKGVAIQGGFEGDLGEGGQVGFASNLSFLGNSYFLTGRYSQAGGLSATGSYGLAVSAIPIRGGGALLKLKGDRFPLPLEGAPFPVSFDVSGLVTPDGEWSADFTQFTIYNVPLPQAPHATVRLAGRLTPQLIDVSRIVVSSGSTAADGDVPAAGVPTGTSAAGSPAPADLSGVARAELRLPADVFSPDFLRLVGLQGSASLRSADGAESYTLKGSLEEGALALTTQFDGVPVVRLGIKELGGAVSGSGTISGPLDGPSVELSVALKQGRLGTDGLALGGRLVIAPGQVQVHGVSFSYLSHQLTGGEGSADLARGTYSFKGLFQTEVFADSIKLGLGLDGSWAAGAKSPGSAGLFDLGLQGRMTLSDISVAGSPVPGWSVSFRTTGQRASPGASLGPGGIPGAGSGGQAAPLGAGGAGSPGLGTRLAFDGGPGNSMHGWVDPQLGFGGSLLAPLPVTGTVQGRVAAGRVHAVLDVDSFDLNVLNQVLKASQVNMGAGPSPVIRFTAGVGAGKVSIDGEVNDPDMTGELDIVGGGILTAYSPDEAGPIKTSLLFEGKSFRVPRTMAPAGQARMSAEARFTIDHWVPAAWELSLGTEQGTAVRARTRFGVLNAEGSVSGMLHIQGDDRRTAVNGALTVSDCRITLGKAPTEKFVPEEPPTIANVTVETGRRVEFHWPTADLPVVRTTATPGGKIAVTYRGDTGAFTVKGSTNVQGGEIYYFDRSFIMKRGSITFNENQATFDPWITARAEAREWDQAAGQEVRVYLDADSPFSKFSPRFSSDPPRSETEILAMIGAPFINRADTQGIGMAAFLYSDILSQNWILRPFEQKVRQVMNLDMFSVRTQIIQNLAAQKVLGTTVNPLDNTSVSIGKYIGNDLFLEMLVRLQQPQIPVAVVTAQGGLIAQSMALQTELELNLEWATPFFLMEWSFLPQHPETLFLSDNSLSFSWRFSY